MGTIVLEVFLLPSHYSPICDLMTPNPQEVFTETSKQALFTDLKEFGKWLLSKNVLSKLPPLDRVIDFPFAEDDWVMNVDEKRKSVSFNTYMVDGTSPDFYRLVVIHEYFQLVVQRVPHKEKVTKIKDTFGSELMKLIDIQADIFTALFLKETKGYSLDQYLRILFIGRSAFSDSWIRPMKLERFIGSVLSVGRIFLATNKNGDLREYHSYLPTISPFYTENCLRLLVLKNEHIYYRDVTVDSDDILVLKQCYGDNSHMEVEDYVNALKDFIQRVIGTDIVNLN